MTKIKYQSCDIMHSDERKKSEKAQVHLPQ